MTKKTHKIQKDFNTIDKHEKKVDELRLRLTPYVKGKLKSTYSERSYPDPYDDKFRVRFRSMNEYVEFCLRILNSFSSDDWFRFSNSLRRED